MIISFLLAVSGWWLIDFFIESERAKERRHREMLAKLSRR